MSRPLRLDFPGALHHVIARGNEGKNIFRDVKDKEKFLEIFSELIDRYGFVMHAYCLMDNHIHSLVETGNIPLSRLMQEVLTKYVQEFNRRWERRGHLLQGRHSAILVDRKMYLLTVVRYIHLNPVNAGIVTIPEAYRWSSYREYVGIPEFISSNLVLSYFSSIEDFKRFTLDGLKEGLPESHKVQGFPVYGTKIFIKKTLKKMKKERRKKRKGKIEMDVVDKFIREYYGSGINEIEKYGRNEVKKAVCIILRERVHLTWKQIGNILGISSSGANRIYTREGKNRNIFIRNFSKWWQRDEKN